MARRGTEDQFDTLHARTVRILNTMLEAAEKGMLCVGEDKDGNKLIGLPPPQLLAQAIKFLSENGVNRPASSAKKTDVLKDEMPDFDAEDTVVPFRNHR